VLIINYTEDDILPKRKEHQFIDGIEMKECSRCRKVLPLADYNKDPSKWDGLYGFCKLCKKENDHRIYMKDPKKKYQKVIEYQRKIGLISRYKPYNPAYYSSEKSKRNKRARDLKRRVLKKNIDAYSKITKDIIDKLFEKYNRKCAYCEIDCTNEYHIDHKLPISRGGDNSFENLALSCPHCNWSKNNKTDIEFIGKAV